MGTDMDMDMVDRRATSRVWQRCKRQARTEDIGRGGGKGEAGKYDASWGESTREGEGSEDNVEGRRV